MSNSKCVAFSVTARPPELYTKIVRLTLITGVALIILGCAALVFPGFNVTKEKKVLDFGPIKAETRETERIAVPPALAWVLVAGGIVVVVISARGLRR
jgi:hypothetical protein